MAKIIEITYSESKTLQELSFEPRNFHISAKAEVDSDIENIPNVYDMLKVIVKKELQEEIEKIKGKDITKDDSIPF